MANQSGIELVSELRWVTYARETLAHWSLQNAAVKPLSLPENATYLVEAVSG